MNYSKYFCFFFVLFFVLFSVLLFLLNPEISLFVSFFRRRIALYWTIHKSIMRPFSIIIYLSKCKYSSPFCCQSLFGSINIRTLCELDSLSRPIEWWSNRNAYVSPSVTGRRNLCCLTSGFWSPWWTATWQYSKHAHENNKVCSKSSWLLWWWWEKVMTAKQKQGSFLQSPHIIISVCCCSIPRIFFIFWNLFWNALPS